MDRAQLSEYAAEGFWTFMFLVLIGYVVAIVVAILDTDLLMAVAFIISTVVGGAVACVVLYLFVAFLGYLKTDFRGDVERWRNG